MKSFSFAPFFKRHGWAVQMWCTVFCILRGVYGCSGCHPGSNHVKLPWKRFSSFTFLNIIRDVHSVTVPLSPGNMPALKYFQIKGWIQTISMKNKLKFFKFCQTLLLPLTLHFHVDFAYWVVFRQRKIKVKNTNLISQFPKAFPLPKNLIFWIRP